MLSVKRLSIGSMEIDMFHYALTYTISQRVVVLAIAKLLIGMSQGYLFWSAWENIVLMITKSVTAPITMRVKPF